MKESQQWNWNIIQSLDRYKQIEWFFQRYKNSFSNLLVDSPRYPLHKTTASSRTENCAFVYKSACWSVHFVQNSQQQQEKYSKDSRERRRPTKPVLAREINQDSYFLNIKEPLKSSSSIRRRRRSISACCLLLSFFISSFISSSNPPIYPDRQTNRQTNTYWSICLLLTPSCHRAGYPNLLRLMTCRWVLRPLSQPSPWSRSNPCRVSRWLGPTTR